MTWFAWVNSRSWKPMNRSVDWQDADEDEDEDDDGDDDHDHDDDKDHPHANSDEIRKATIIIGVTW